VTGYLAGLDRPELDALLADAEHSSVKAQVAMSVTPLVEERVYAAAGVAADCLGLWLDAMEESIYRNLRRWPRTIACGIWAATMADPYVQTISHVTDIDGITVTIGVDYDAVTIGQYRFDEAGCEELARVLIVACWQAARCDYKDPGDG